MEADRQFASVAVCRVAVTESLPVLPGVNNVSLRAAGDVREGSGHGKVTT